jgi:hypothetical protein
MANRFRGEIEAEIGGARRILCLTLGALAELETAFGARDLVALAERFQRGRLSARDISIILACGLRGGGAVVSNAEVEAMRTPDGLGGFVRIAADLIAATFGESEAGDRPRPPAPQDA